MATPKKLETRNLAEEAAQADREQFAKTIWEMYDFRKKNGVH